MATARLIPGTALTLVLCALASLEAQAPRPRPRPSPPAPSRAVPAPVPQATIVLGADAPCRVTVDGGEPLELDANATRVLTLDPGEHIVIAISTEFPEAISRKTVTAEAGQRKAVLIELGALLAPARAASEARRAADAERARAAAADAAALARARELVGVWSIRTGEVPHGGRRTVTVAGEGRNLTARFELTDFVFLRPRTVITGTFELAVGPDATTMSPASVEVTELSPPTLGIPAFSSSEEALRQRREEMAAMEAQREARRRAARVDRMEFTPEGLRVIGAYVPDLYGDQRPVSLNLILRKTTEADIAREDAAALDAARAGTKGVVDQAIQAMGGWSKINAITNITRGYRTFWDKVPEVTVSRYYRSGPSGLEEFRTEIREKRSDSRPAWVRVNVNGRWLEKGKVPEWGGFVLPDERFPALLAELIGLSKNPDCIPSGSSQIFCISSGKSIRVPGPDRQAFGPGQWAVGDGVAVPPSVGLETFSTVSTAPLDPKLFEAP